MHSLAKHVCALLKNVKCNSAGARTIDRPCAPHATRRQQEAGRQGCTARSWHASFTSCRCQNGMSAFWRCTTQKCSTFTSSTCCIHLRSEEHTSELKSLMRLSYAVF